MFGHGFRVTDSWDEAPGSSSGLVLHTFPYSGSGNMVSGGNPTHSRTRTRSFTGGMTSGGTATVAMEINISNLTLWLNSERDITLTGGKVSQWDDQSASNNDVTQSTDSLRPVVVNSVINGYPVVRFTNDVLGRSGITNNIDNSDGAVLFIVFQITGAPPANFTVPFSIPYQSTTAGWEFRIDTGSTVDANMVAGAGVTRTLSETAALANSTPYLYIMAYDNPNPVEFYISRNNTFFDFTVAGTSPLNTNFDELALGARRFLDNTSEGYGESNFDVAEIIMYNAAIGRRNMILALHYLRDRYNFTLPTNTFWDLSANLADLAQNRPGGAVMSHSGNTWIYVVGGTDGATTLSRVQRALINPTTGDLGAWSILAIGNDLPAVRKLGSMAYNSTAMWFTGGQNGSSVNQTSVYKGVIDASGDITWTTQTSFPTATSEHASVIVGNYLYVIGGANSNVFYADISSGTISSWSTATAVLPNLGTGYDNMSAVTYGGHIFVGLNGSSPYKIYRGTPTGGGDVTSWTTITTDLTDGEDANALVMISNYIYNLGGSSTAQLSRIPVDGSGNLGASEALTPSGGATLHVGLTHNSRLYVIGGNVDGDAVYIGELG